MKTISIINLKGGVAKTLTADSMAHVLATFHNKRVLLVDNDKQGNTSKAFGVHSYDDKSISDVLTARRLDPREVIKKTRFENIDVMPANMTLIRANMEVLMDSTRPQQTRLRSALNTIAAENLYDFCIIDNAPDINISTINALVASDDVIIPIKIDKYAFDGLEELKEQIEDTRDDLNPRLRLAGCLITCFIRADAEKQGEAWLRSRPEYPVFDTRIRYSDSALSADTIAADVAAAVKSFQKWQAEKMGRDVNLSQLIALLMQTGVKRVEVRSPVFATVADNAVAQVGTVSVVNGGAERE